MVSNPNNYVALNNIGGIFLQLGKLNVAEKYFTNAYKSNPKFPNVTLGLGLVNFHQGELKTAFDFFIETFRNEENTNSTIYQKALQHAIECSKTLVNQQVGKESLVDFFQRIEKLSGKEVRIEEDPTLTKAAKVEFAENYGRDFHLVITNPKYPNTDHLIAHELTHLYFAEEARKVGVNMLFIGNEDKIEDFKKTITGTLKKLEKMGLPESSILKYSKDLFQGILGQVFNTPIDLFIEDYLFHQFPELRYVQFLSLYQLNQEAHTAVNDPKIIDISPPNILTKSKIFNVLSARHFESLFGLKMEKTYSVKPVEKEQVDAFWDEFNEYRSNKNAGEEYELIHNWGEDLELDEYFQLVDENQYRSNQNKVSKSPEDVLNQIETDPLQGGDLDAEDEEEFQKFKQQYSSTDLNMAVAMYMVSALNHLKKMPQNGIKEIAFEIAILGRSGIDPQKKGYKLSQFPNSSFSGHKLLAFYYVSWALGMPDMIQELQLPFEKEFALALQISK